jgi:hypothetical protein
MAHVQPIRDEDLPEVCAFLGRTLNPSLPAPDCVRAFRHPWAAEKPNNGFMLVDGRQVVGVLGAIYSDQIIRGNRERFCNLTSWSVLEEFRSESMLLMRELLVQKGFHFTSFTPNSSLVPVYRGLKFIPLDHRQWMVPCVPWPGPQAGSLLTEPGEIERNLTPESAKAFRDHRGLPWIRGVALGRSGRYGLVLYRRRRRRRHTSAEILHVGEGDLFVRCHRSLARHLFWTERALTFTVDARFLPRKPFPALATQGPQIRLYLSKTLSPNDIELLYSEVVALNA